MNKTTVVRQIYIDEIDSSGRYRHKYKNEKEWDDFKENINQNGLISAISVHEYGERKYKLLAGGHRLEACRELGHTMINATIYTGDIDVTDMKIIELSENLKRKNFTPFEEAQAKSDFFTLMQAKYGTKENKGDEGVSLRDAAKMLGESPANLSRDISLAKAFEVMPELLKAKTKNEAQKMAKNNLKKLTEFKAVKKIDKEKAETGSTALEYLENRYYINDFFKGAEELGDNTINLFEIDPPYGIDLKSIKKKPADSVTSIYNEVPAEEYETFMRKVFSECYRIGTDRSWMIVWYAPEPWGELIYQWAIDAGWNGKRIPGIWDKTGGSFQNNAPLYNLSSSVEYFYYFSKGPAEIKKEGRRNLFTFKPVNTNNKTHPTERPIELIEEILSTFTFKGSKILVPFLGSGNTILAAENLNCLAYGYDLEQQYKTSYKVKLYGKKIAGKYTSIIS